MTARVGRITILSALAIALAVPAAQASSVDVSGGVMTITAKPGEENEVEFGAAGSDERGPLIRVIDGGTEDIQPNTSSSPRIVAGGSCNQSSDGRDAFCPTTDLTRIVVNLGDGNDEYDGSLDVDTEIDLGDGDDDVKTDEGSDVLRGGDGDDTFEGGGTGSGSDELDTYEGGEGDDTFDLRRADSDDVSGGPDQDTATLVSRSGSGGVTITIDDLANDGTSNEGDNIRTDVEKVIGTNRNDTLNGSSGPDILEGALGADSFKGNGGADTFLLRDGVRDNFFCIDGNDTVDKDLQDPFNVPCAFLSLRNPNIVIRFNAFTGAVDEGPNVRIAPRALRVNDDNEVLVRLRCPRRLPGGCDGRLALREATRDARRLDSGGYEMRRGRRDTVTLELGAAERRKVLRHGVVALEAVEDGRHGPKTTNAFRAIR
jgi:hypothetical protein